MCKEVTVRAELSFTLLIVTSEEVSPDTTLVRVVINVVLDNGLELKAEAEIPESP